MNEGIYSDLTKKRANGLSLSAKLLRSLGFAALSIGAIALVGCQRGSDSTASPAESESNVAEEAAKVNGNTDSGTEMEQAMPGDGAGPDTMNREMMNPGSDQGMDHDGGSAMDYQGGDMMPQDGMMEDQAAQDGY